MAEVLPYIVATAGHVDHGKSALVRALTGVETDRLPEEKARGISIELGFAHIDLQAGEDVLQVGLVDVPGHEDFVKNMVAGVGSVDAALLVVAADDGWMPQTEEHLQILSYLGVSRGVVAVTKADVVEDVEGAVGRVREQLRGTGLESAVVVATSVKDGRGLEELKGALREVLRGAPPQGEIGKPRLGVDRAFTLRGVGTVVTGTLAGGSVRRGQEVVVQRGGARAKVRSVQTYGRDVEGARPGSRVALNLPELATGETRGPKTVHRGDVVTVKELGPPTRAVDVLLEKSPRAQGHELREGARLWVHHGSGATPAKVHFYEGKTLAPGERRAGRLALAEPAFVLVGDRVVIRDWSARHTLAGAIVLDVDPGRDRERQAAMVAARAAEVGNVEAYVTSQLKRDGVVARQGLLVRSRFGPGEVRTAVEAIVGRGEAVAATREWLVEAAEWREALAKVAAAVDGHHQAKPEQPGLAVADVRQLVPWRQGAAELADALIVAMRAEGFEQRGAAMARATHRPALPPRLEGAGREIEAKLAERALEPPSRKELTASDLGQQAMKFLIATGRVVELGADLVLGAEAYRGAVERVRELLAREGSATVSQIKAALGSTRRVVVPLCERLDRDGVTLRRGDFRMLREG